MEMPENSKALNCGVVRVWSQAFRDLSIDISARPIMQFAVELTAECMPASHVFVGALADSGRRLRSLATLGFESGEIGYFQGEACPDTLTARAFPSGNQRLSDRALKGAAVRIADMVRFLNLRSGISVPIVCGGRPWGVFGAYSECTRQYGRSKIGLLNRVANVVADLVQESGSAGEEASAANPESAAADAAGIQAQVSRLESALLLQTDELLKVSITLEHELRNNRKAQVRLRASEKQLRLLSFQLMRAQEMERKRIAGELHDSIGQRMGVVKYQLENILAQVNDKDSRPFADQLEALVGSVRAGMEEVRKIAMDLRPSILDDLGLLLTIDWFCREFGNTYRNIAIEKYVAMDESLIPDAHKLAIFRIIQEAMNNVAKYACASLIRLEFSGKGDGVYLRICDNGRGFDSARVCGGGFVHGLGLRSMRERAEAIGGRFSIDSVIGEGTSIQVFWPEQIWSARLP